MRSKYVRQADFQVRAVNGEILTVTATDLTDAEDRAKHLCMSKGGVKSVVIQHVAVGSIR